MARAVDDTFINEAYDQYGYTVALLKPLDLFMEYVAIWMSPGRL